PTGRLIWVHAASVGETNAVLPMIVGLRRARPDAAVLLTTTTVTSARIAAERLPPGAFHQYAPLDVPQYTRTFLDHWRPDLAVFTESEIWPSLILETHGRGVPLALVNGRLSPKSYRRWLRLSGFAEPLFGRFDIVLAQSEKVGRWFRDVGARHVIPAGNLKADSPPPPVDAAKRVALEVELGGRRPLLAASTHDGEEAIVAAAHNMIAQRSPGYVTIIAPRHPERGAAIAAALSAVMSDTRTKLAVALRSRGDPVPADGGIYIADTMGELGVFYSVCPVVLMGGSLIRHGGQNPLEAIPFGAALLTGPHTHNFRVEYQALAKAGGVVEVTKSDDIASEVTRLLGDAPARNSMAGRAANTLEGLRGALGKTLAALLPLLRPPVATVGLPGGTDSITGVARRLPVQTVHPLSLDRAG
ncbi:MAG: 3-deoxy-D-manno-octulosonic acid transferase, partial [Hyphomicrobiaceae bacterium]|nr:3-deoxy-D-manno-octulosonic acid transferase [Hyphomicrobiaceae bacterium]